MYDVKKKKKILLTMVLVFIIILAMILTFFLTREKNYSIEYTVDNFKITESYDRELKRYHFKMEKDDESYETISTHKYVGKKNLIERIDVFEEEEEKEHCIYPHSAKLELYPQCSKDDQKIDIALLESDNSDFYERPKVKRQQSTYKNISLNATNGLKFLIWAHKGYISLSGEKAKGDTYGDSGPTFLQNESYYNKLSYQLDEYVLTPNYDQEYSFDTLFIFNFKKGSLTEWKLDFEISYNSYYLGDYEGKIYLFDRKNEVEYALNPKKKKMEIVTKDKMGKVYLEDWKDVSVTKLSSKEYTFEKKENYIYKIQDDKLVLQYYGSKEKIVVSKQPISSIVAQRGEKVYYLVKDKLYEYSPKYGEVLLLTYSEWAFNSLNAIYIY